MPNLIVQLIILLIICGFLYWAWTLISPILASFIGSPFMAFINALVLILFGAIIIFWGIIPLLRAVASSGLIHG